MYRYKILKKEKDKKNHKQKKIKIQNKINRMTLKTIVLVTGFDSELVWCGPNICPERSLIEE